MVFVTAALANPYTQFPAVLYETSHRELCFENSQGKKMQVLRVSSIEIKTFSGIKISFNLIQLHFIRILPLL